MFKWIQRISHVGSKCWKSIIMVMTPLILLPALIMNYHSLEYRCAYVIIIMSIYWIFEPIPLPVTALIPVVLFPLLGILTTEQACAPYLQATNMLFMASLAIAIAVEHSQLHKRIAYNILITIGTDIRWLILGFMITAMFLGIWIINTAATAMLLPIADVIIEELFFNPNKRASIASSSSDNIHNNIELINHDDDGLYENPRDYGNDKKVITKLDQYKPGDEIANKKNDKLRRILYLSIAYSATIGGTTTLTSNGPNLVFRWILDDIYHGLPQVDYTSWMLFCILSTIFTVSIVWFTFKLFFMRDENISECNKTTKQIIVKKYQELGPMTFHEASVCVMFVLLIILWVFRDPKFFPGWALLVDNGFKPKDATAAILVVILLFMIPSNPLGPYPSPSLLNWNLVQSKLAWGVILLRGGGFSMADAASRSGLAKHLGIQLSQLSKFPLTVTVILISFLASFITELASNSSVATILLPIFGQMASNMMINPLRFLVPITLSCSYAFVLPVGTPANALVFDHAKLRSSDLFIPGLATKIISLFIMLINYHLLGPIIFNFDEFPDWALVNEPNSTTIKP